METRALTKPVNNILEALAPFKADDGHKGTFLLLRIAGLEQGMALKVVNRKFRSWQHWRATDEYFRDIDDAILELSARFGGEARVVRTALLDISVVETGINIFKKILARQPITEGMWAYATKMAGLRVPMMGAHLESSSPWERLANSIQQTMAQREVIITHEVDGSKSVATRETIIQPSPEQKRAVDNIVQRILQGGGN